MACMDTAEFHRIADQFGAPTEEREHELANARYDIARRPETVHGRDAYQIAADALTAHRALPHPKLAEVRFLHHSWTPGGLSPALYGPTPADLFMRWYSKATAGRR